jgi:hypothetical protein
VRTHLYVIVARIALAFFLFFFSLEFYNIRSSTICVVLCRDTISHSRTKYIDVRYHYIRQLVVFGKAYIEYKPTEEMLADLLTKPLALTAFRRCINGLLAL